MSITIPGYKLSNIIHEGVNTVIYRAIKKPEETPAIVKLLKSEYPTLEEITRLRHEYKILQPLEIEGIVKVYSLENYGNGLAMILEDFGGESLKKILTTQKVPLIEFFNIAIQIVSTIADLHKNKVIHKDIKPHNILVNQENGQVKLIDFSISSRLSRQNQTVSNPRQLEGTLAYMSPEQTGRMNRSIDYRSDFYSLGVTFYEMLTGQLPFNTADILELIHCHIAQIPVAPDRVNPEIPRVVSDIVMKLLSKTAEERYQNALGLKADLEKCLTQLQTSGQIKNFIPAQLDLHSQFLIPQKLYGRDREVRTLLDAFERVSCGSTEIMLVSGYSGIGKTSVINEIQKPIVQQRGYFISGKFDQFKRNIPYYSLVQAFQDLLKQLLTESEEILASWKEKLLTALGDRGRVIINVIPELELIIGSQPNVPEVGLNESQNRFNRVFKQFVNVFATKEHPLVVFLDDLQWADSASLKLINLLVTDSESEYLLMIGAYRDNEVSSTHPLMLTLEEIEKTSAIVNQIILGPLDFSNVKELASETIRDRTERSQPLCELLFNKTQGNPFFLTQLLQTLYAEKLLTFDFSADMWRWDIGHIQAIGITDLNVVELIARNIQKLSPEAQQVLKLAACIGNRFNLDVLAVVNEKNQSETATDLWEALQAGLILPLSEAYKIPLVFDFSSVASGFEQLADDKRSLTISYKFLHDRVQQAAYSLIPEPDKKATHLKIGELLLKNTPADEIEENIFDIVNQLNVGVESITDREQKDELAKLNSIAGKKAKAATAYQPAVVYLNVGLRLLAQDSWKSQYDLTLAIYVEATQAEYLNLNFERAKNLSDIVL
ncbi:serine/threonine-protein kinase PknK, partial [Planktothrix sp. FACHB-1355]